MTGQSCNSCVSVRGLARTKPAPLSTRRTAQRSPRGPTLEKHDRIAVNCLRNHSPDRMPRGSIPRVRGDEVDLIARVTNVHKLAVR